MKQLKLFDRCLPFVLDLLNTIDTTGSSDASRLERLTAGDPLRALAALGVLVLHCAFQFRHEAGGVQEQLGDGGHLGLGSLGVAVSLFFVLSGYLISRPFVRAYLDRTGMPTLRLYARNRVLRIGPMYWATVTFILLLHGSLGSSALGVLGVYLFQQYPFHISAGEVLPQGWTILVEVGYYVLVPLTALAVTAAARRADRATRLRLLAAVLTATWLLSAVGRTQAPGTQGPMGLELALPVWLWGFVPGVALAVLELTVVRTWMFRPRARLLPTALLVLAALSYAGLVATGRPMTESHSLVGTALASLASGSMLAAALTLQWSGRPCWSWLDNRPLRWLGVRSYSMYLLHVLVIVKLQDLFPDPFQGWADFGARLLLTVGVTALASHVTYELIERPFLRRRLNWRRPLQPAAATA